MKAQRYIDSSGKQKIQCYNGRSYDFFDENGGELFMLKGEEPVYIGGQIKKTGGGSWLSVLLLAPFMLGALIYR